MGYKKFFVKGLDFLQTTGFEVGGTGILFYALMNQDRDTAITGCLVAVMGLSNSYTKSRVEELEERLTNTLDQLRLENKLDDENKN